jgi:LytS/YehU family sensor histidine kinase
MKIARLGFLFSPWIIALAFTLLFTFCLVPAGIKIYPAFFDESTDYYHWIIFFPLLYVGFLLLIFISQKAFVLRRNNTAPVAQKLSLLKFQSIKDRLSPHFIFNVMNTLANQVLKGNKLEAYDYITKISGFLRQVMDSSDDVSVHLGGELKLIEKYIQLQWLRFSGNFDYNISIADDVPLSKSIPKAIVLTFVENAIRHALFHKQGGGFLTINVKIQDKDTLVIIQDNGIDAKTIARSPKSKTEADILEGLNKDIAFFNSFNKSQINYHIQALHNENGEYSGKAITLRIPDCYHSAIGLEPDDCKKVKAL